MTSIKHLYGYVFTSSLRKKIVLLLSKKPMRQSEIAIRLKQKQPNVSKAMMDLEKQKIVECLTPDKKAWKLYDLTDTGKEVINYRKI